MDQFEYLSVLISIILGLGITQLLSGLGRWLERRETFRLYAPSMLWAVLLMVVHVQTWWSMFGMRNFADWTFLQFSVVPLQPGILFLLAVLAFPGPASDDDLRTNFFRQRRWFFGLFITLLVVSVLKDVIRSGELPNTANLAFHGVFLVASVSAYVTTREWYHKLLAYSSLVVFAVYIIFLFARLET